jgi:hypothetical protein
MEAVVLADLVDPLDPEGRTFREVNKTMPHNIPLGVLVEVKWDEWFGGGACQKVHARLWVVGHDRDCDGTPLYTLSRWQDADFAFAVRQFHSGMSERMLTPIDVTESVRRGEDALGWSEVPHAD